MSQDTVIVILLGIVALLLLALIAGGIALAVYIVRRPAPAVAPPGGIAALRAELDEIRKQPREVDRDDVDTPAPDQMNPGIDGDINQAGDERFMA